MGLVVVNRSKYVYIYIYIYILILWLEMTRFIIHPSTNRTNKMKRIKFKIEGFR